MNSSGETHPSASAPEEDPGAYPIPFSTQDIELGSRLDSIPPSLRFWAVDKGRSSRSWYDDMVRANDRYEEWLSTQPPGEYPVPFSSAKGRKLSEIEDSFRNWAVHPDRSHSRWYDYFVRANARYEKHLTATREPGEFPCPQGKYKGIAIKDVPQNAVWWVLRPSNSEQHWYKPMYDANKRFLDNVYQSRSPGSEPIWFGTRYRGLRLDQAYERKGFIRWCLGKGDHGWVYRLGDLVRRLEQWRLEHPERSGPRQRRKAPNIQNPVGEAIGPWDDSAGSAAEDEDYEKDDFVVPDSDDEDSSTGEEVCSDNGMDDSPPDPDDSASSSEDMFPSESVRPMHKRSHANIVLSDAEGEEEEARKSSGRLGRKYRVLYQSSQE